MKARRKRHQMPDDVREALLKNRLWDAYRARPPYQQNDYIGWIESCARTETRTKRTEQMLEELRRGGVYMKMVWGGTREKQPVRRPGRVYDIKRAKVHVFQGVAAWHFAVLPTREAGVIRNAFKHVARGWGSLPVTVTLGATTWTTSIFPDTKSDSYVLPLKAEVRKKEAVRAGNAISFRLEVR